MRQSLVIDILPKCERLFLCPQTGDGRLLMLNDLQIIENRTMSHSLSEYLLLLHLIS